jgi:hypothetical protein
VAVGGAIPLARDGDVPGPPPERTGIKDINDILQGKDKVLKSVDDLIDRGWLNKISDDKNILKLLIKEKTKSL